MVECINDNQDLVLQIVEKKVPSVNNSLYTSYSSITSIADNEIVEYVDYSFNELKTVYDIINSNLLNESNDYDNFVSNSIDFLKNRVVVTLVDNTKEKQKEFKENIIDSDLIVFEKGERNRILLNPGDAVEQCTLGFRAKLNGQSGYITAGHCTQSNNDIGKSYGYGTIKKRVFGGNADAMFVQTTTSVTNSVAKWTSYPAITFNGTALPVVGQKVGKYGNKTGATTGTITIAYYSDYVSAIETDEIQAYLTDMYKTNLYSEKGDSGGPIFTLTTTNNLMGILTSGNSNGQSSSINPITSGIRVDNINSRLGTVRY